MQSLLKVIGLISDLVSWVVRVKRSEKRKAEIDAIRKDPAGQFINEFGGVPDSEAKHSVSGTEAGVEIDRSKPIGRRVY